MNMTELPLFSNPRCSVSMSERTDQPTDDCDRRFKTLLLTLRVTLTCPSSSSAAAAEVRRYTRKFSEPLHAFTHPRHLWAARNKVGRMLDALWVPHRRVSRDLVDKIIAGVRRLASDFEDLPPVLRAEADVHAVVLRLPPVEELELEDDDGAPTFLDGADSRDYERYKDEDDLPYNDGHVQDVIEYDDNEDYAGWPHGGEEQAVCRRLMDYKIEPGDELYPNGASPQNKMVVISLNVTFRLPPPLFTAGDEQIMGHNFCERLEVIADDWHAKRRISKMLRRVWVPRRFMEEAAERILQEVRSAMQRRLHDFDAMWVALTLEVFAYYKPDLSTTARFLNKSLYYYQANSDMYVARRPWRTDHIAPLDLHDGTHPRFVPASKDTIESLEKAVLSEDDDMSMNCMVCLEAIPVSSEITRLPCCHYFHGVCIVEWLKNIKYCPVCRFSLPSL